ncbi:oxaloacetate decarboxylase subunit gamma [Photobacterium sp. SDRW27]|uniref:oxaloacetate decarboxylase subunit gamma n=1 Tax=Photobacterium obscurum TaxID=2829490 RepID=UPI00224392DA|nr:oxaloacetate decarboxylase subunit gamma [Photobacterium obscurum]MCW8330617.1 oxaloacetate decarboxylase subunit gamma [Photobacterium obscurum]
MAGLGSLLWEAATIMATGMLVVFVFLSTLIFLVQLLAKVASKEATPELKAQPATTVASNHNGVQPDVVAAITAAVSQYRQRNA